MADPVEVRIAIRDERSPDELRAALSRAESRARVAERRLTIVNAALRRRGRILWGENAPWRLRRMLGDYAVDQLRDHVLELEYRRRRARR